MSFRSIGETTVSVSGTSAKKELPTRKVQDAGGQSNVVVVGNKVRLQADGADMYYKVGGSGVTATTADTFLQDNAIEEFSIQPGETHIAAIGSSGTLHVTVGTSK
jgi:hypothetical protein